MANIAKADATIKRLIKVNLTPNEKAAITSLVFNVGSGALAGSSALKLLNNGDKEGFVYEAFDKNKGFVREKGKISAGLVSRRAKERALFLS